MNKDEVMAYKLKHALLDYCRENDDCEECKLNTDMGGCTACIMITKITMILEDKSKWIIC